MSVSDGRQRASTAAWSARSAFPPTRVLSPACPVFSFAFLVGWCTSKLPAPVARLGLAGSGLGILELPPGAWRAKLPREIRGTRRLGALRSLLVGFGQCCSFGRTVRPCWWSVSRASAGSGKFHPSIALAPAACSSSPPGHSGSPSTLLRSRREGGVNHVLGKTRRSGPSRQLRLSAFRVAARPVRKRQYRCWEWNR